MNTPFTYSNYSTLRQCGAKFRFSCVDKLPQPPTVALEFGSALHAALNDSLTTQDSDSAINVFEAYWCGLDHGKFDYKNERLKELELTQAGVKFVANFTKKYAAKMKLIIGEKRLKKDWVYHTEDWTNSLTGAPIDQHEPIEGTPDALVEWNGQNVLLDFKSSAYNYDPLKSDISLQLNLYAWLLEENGYKVDSFCYFVFNKGTGSIQTPILIPYDRKKALAMIEEAVRYWKRNVEHFEKNPNACIIGKQICSFAGKCWK